MNYYDFESTTYGKWVLAGEHAVLRGHCALVFPILNKTMTLQYKETPNQLTLEYSNKQGTDLRPLLLKVLEEGMHLLKKPWHALHGYFHLESNIPIGVGLGASASLCVVIARWFAAKKLIPLEQTQEFAKTLEHLFHGQSSGLDIAGVAANTGIYFQQGKITPIKQTWNPTWYLSTCGQTGMTLPCIQQVKTLFETNPALAELIDTEMQNSVIDAQQALEHDTPQSQSQLANAMNRAAHCFQQWGLITPELHHHMQALKDAGAIAVKPTGSGGGGYVISLWPDTPVNTAIELIRV